MASEEVGDHAVCSAASESFFGAIKREISYVSKYQSHIDDLENQVKQLGYKRQRVENLVNAARRQGDEIYKGVEQWLISIDEFTQKVVKPIIDNQDEAKKHCFKGLCPYLLKRYNLSKEAVKAANDGANLLGKGNFSNFCFHPAPLRIELMSSRDYHQFNSRRSIFRDIMEAMKDDEVNMIGVYGSGGVGKTTLVKAVARQVIEEKLFDEVVMVEVTRTPDQKPIQDKIASDLGLQFGQHDNVLQRAVLLSERLKKEKRVLIILDNIWMRLDLDAIGIPFWGNEKQSVRQQEDWKERYVDQSRHKILLTSRNQHVLCNEMNIQKTFSIGVLSDEEASGFFWSNVGDAAGRSDFLPIGVEIVRECRGFPIAVITIANALKNKILFFWKDAFDQLRNSNQRRIGGEDANVYSIIELSYNFLETEEAKSLFRLCGLLNGGSQVPIDALMRCGMGLGLLKGVYTLQEARKRVNMLVNALKASRLLLDGDAEECLKMHDIIHSIAVSVATEKLMFNMQNVADLKEALDKKTHKDPTAISIPFRGIYEFPERLECPKLKLFVLFSENLSLRIPDPFLEGMTELRVLSFTGFRFPSLPSSIGCLISLRTLTLESCLLGDVATIGDLKKLEILSLRHSDIEQLPGEIGQLTRLKLLDLSNCMKLKVIRPNVISSLSRLEELYMGNSFTEWEIEGQSNASLVELKQLSRLTTLEVHIPDAQVMPQDLLSVELERYRICIGDAWSWSGGRETSRRLKLSALDKCIYLGFGMQMLLKGIDDLYLDELNGFQNALHELEDGEVFPRLKHLHVQNACEILYIVNLEGWGHCNSFPLLESLFLHNLMRLEKVYHGQLTEQSFSKLRIIKVCQCDRLKHLFSLSMARNLLQLQKIKVSFCESLKLIVGKESSETHNIPEIINFTQLHSLTLQCLPQLTSSGFDLERPLLSPTISATTSATTLAFEEVIAEDDSDESLFNNKVIFPNLEKLKLSSINIEKIWHDQYTLILNSCGQNLTNLTVETCSRLKFLFSYSMVDSLVRLQQLEIRKCESMEAVIDTTDIGIYSVEFPSLHHLRIVDCPNLRSFISVNSSEEKILHTDKQPLFDEKLVLPRLEVLSIDMMDNMKNIWHHQLALNSFSKLRALEVTNCGKLLNIFPANIIMRRRLDRLEYLKVDGCASVEEIIGETSSNGNICMVEEEVEARRRFLFPRLTWLNLSLLPRLKSFCPGVDVSEWPLLKSLGVFGCDSVEILFASPEYFRCESQRPLFLLDPKAAFPSLKELELNNLPKLLHLWKENSQLSKVLRSLATLEISECSKLEKLVPSSVSLENLITLEVSKCDGLIHLVTLSTAESLVKLRRMNVIDCKMLQQIILQVGEEVKKDCIVFSQLKYLGLHCLPCLTSFCLGNLTLEFPCLEQVIVRECPNMKIFSQGVLHTPKLQRLHLREEYDEGLWEGSLNSTIQKLFEEMVGYHDKACLKLSEFPHLKEIWHGQALPVSFFINLKWLVVDDCRFMMGAIPANQLQYLINLKTLEVRNCYSLEQVFHLEEQNPIGQFRSLFPKLRNLKLINLPQLIRFCNFTGRIIELPSLVNLWIENCRNMKTFISSSTPVIIAPNKEPQQMTSQKKLLGDIQPLFDEKVKLPSLEVLGIKRMDNLRKLWQDRLSLDSFCKLNYLGIQRCEKLLSIFPWNMLERMQNLEKLEVFYCNSVREILELQMLDCRDTHGLKVAQLRETVPNFAFPHLTSLKLHSLPRLRSFSPGVHVSKWPSLKNLYLGKCANVEIFASEFLSPQEIHLDGHCDIQIRRPFFYVNKVAFPSLEELKLSNLPKLLHLWKGNSQPSKAFQNLATLEISECSKLEKLVPPSVSFENLKTLEVLKCDGLRNLVTLSTTESLVKLTRMNVTDCKMIKEIIEQVGEEVKTDSIVFCQLKYLELHCLPGFTYFYLGNDTLEFPFLEQAVVRQCPKMKFFCQGILSTPKLQRLQLTELEDEGCWEGNLNSTIQKLFEDMVGYRGVVYLKLSQSPHLEEIWHSKALPVSLFSSLQWLVVDDIRFFSSAIPANLLRHLNNLKTLEVSNCYSLEEVFHLEDPNANEHCWPLFPKLLHLKLVDLPKLMSFCSFTGSIIELPSLVILRIENCPKMKTFISSSTPVNMAANKEPQEITSEENFLADEQPFFDEKVAFPSLEELRLSRLPKLFRLCKETSHPRNVFQNLAALEISECSKLDILVPSSVSFGNLTTLEVSKCGRLMSLMTISTVESLVNLARMNITDCPMIQQIIQQVGEVEKDCIVFSQLKYLGLHCLPSLKSFCVGGKTLEFPCLEKVIVRECPKMMIFSHGVLQTPKLRRLELTEEDDEGRWEGNLNSTIQKLFVEMVGFCDLKCLKLSLFPNLKEIWHGQPLPVSFFSNLRSLVVDDCMYFLSAIPAKLLGSLNNLEKLEVSNCDSLEEVFHLEEPNADEHYGSLFPKLRELKLKDLPKLKRFCNFANDIIELPFLSCMWIESCPNMVTFVSNSTFAHLTANEAPQEIITEENILADIQPLFDEKVVLPSLEELGLSRMDNLRKIWHDHLTLDSFCKINFLGIRNCNKLLNIFPWNMLGRLEKLRWLFVGNCDSVEEIVELQALSGDNSCAIIAAQLSETIPSFVLPQLISLTLLSLPSLKSFYPGVYISEWPMLKKLEVMDCAEVEIFASEFQSPHESNVDRQCDIKIPQPLFSLDEVAFPSLEELTLCVLPDLLHLLEDNSRPSKVFQNLATLKISECDKLENLAPSSVSFQNLMTLEVSKCDRLINLVTLSTAESLVKLTTMHIAECMTIEEIIQQAKEEARKDCLLFSQLKYLGLHCLPSLMCFCLGNFALEFPTLEKVVVRECPKMEIFSRGVLSTPKLQRLLPTESEDEGRWEGNLNSTIHKLFEEMVGLRDINYLELSQFPHLKEMWHQQALPVSFFSNLSWLVVEDCTFFSSAIPVNLLWFLNNLKILEISNCDSLEEVFHLEELNANEHFGPLFPSLRKLKLKNLPKLIRFCNFIGNVIRLPSLSYMWIESCPNMITFVSNSTPVPMTANKEPHEMTLEENFPADIQPLFDEKVGLPSLEELAILSMDSLRKLWQDELSCHSFCNIKFLGLQKCNKLLNIFPCNMLERLQKLQKLQVLYCSSVREIFELRALSGRDAHTIKTAPLRESDASFVFPQLTSLSLWWLPGLKSFYPQVQISEWPMLKKLDLGGCAQVEIFASEVLSLQQTHVDGQHNIQIPQSLFFVDKVAFPSLEELRLFRLPKLLHLWKENSHPNKVFPNLASLKLSECPKLEKLVPSSVSFQNLTTLEVSKCDGLINLVTRSTAESMVKLVRMSITDCKLIEEIIHPIGEDVKDCIVFSQLTYLGLHCLPTLTSFCLGNYTLEFPSLEQVIVIDCLKMMTFSHGALCTPKLHRLQLTEEDDEGCWDGNLNNTMQQLFKRVNFQNSNDEG